MTLNNDWFFALWLATILGCALVAGVFFAFSTFIMRALARLTPAQGMTAMQSINITVITPIFMLALFGTGAASIALTWLCWSQPNAHFIIASSLFYVLGTLGVTMVKNVPLNDALASASASSEVGAKLWANYLKHWTFWNHVRTISALIAAALILFSFDK